MTTAIDILMNEHRVIEQVLNSLVTFADSLQRNPAEDSRQTVGKYAAFFRNFADKCHHGKEEDRLFTRLVERGFPRETGPVAVMLTEHDMGRAHVGALAEIGSKTGPLSKEEVDQVVEHASEYVPLLLQHIQKEDRILFPMAAQILQGPEMEKLESDFEQFEQHVMGQGEHAKYHALAEELTRSYPPQPNRFSECASSFCCGH